MNEPQAGGPQVHRANALALRLELGLPVTGTGTSAVTFGALEEATLPVIEGIARKAAEDRQDAVFAVYGLDDDRTPAWYFLVFRMLEGVGLMRVNPACRGTDSPLVLLTMDNSRQFAIDERGVFREVSVEKKATRTKALRRGADRIAATAATLGPVFESGAWEGTMFAFRSDGTAVPADTAAA